MADDRTRNPGDQGDPNDPERTAAHRLGPPMRPMRPGGQRSFRGADTGFVDRVTDDGAPVDVAAVRRDDELIEALAAGGAVTTSNNAEFTLASLLADWRDEIVTTPISAGPSVDELLAAASSGHGGTRQVAPAVGGAPSGDGDVTDIGSAPSRRNRRFGLIAGAAAAAVAILGGGTVLVNSASPGDGALWSVKEVVFADAASQTVATSEAKAQIKAADEQIDSSNQAAAQAALVSARQQAAKVKNEKDRAALEEKIRAAEARAGLPVGSTDVATSATQAPSSPSSPSATSPSPATSPAPTTTVPLPTIVTTPDPTTTRPTTTRPTTTTPTTTTTVPPTSEPTEPTGTTTTRTTTTTVTTTPPPTRSATTTVITTTTGAPSGFAVDPAQLFPR